MKAKVPAMLQCRVAGRQGWRRTKPVFLIVSHLHTGKQEKERVQSVSVCLARHLAAFHSHSGEQIHISSSGIWDLAPKGQLFRNTLYCILASRASVRLPLPFLLLQHFDGTFSDDSLMWGGFRSKLQFKAYKPVGMSYVPPEKDKKRNKGALLFLGELTERSERSVCH